MIIAVVDAFYDSKNNHKLCAKVTKTTLDDSSKPNDVVQYSLSSEHSITHLVSLIKKVISTQSDNLYVLIDNFGLSIGVKDELEQCGYNIMSIYQQRIYF